MKQISITLAAIMALAASPAQAFLSSQDETTLLATLNQENLTPGVHYNDIRCSVRNRKCLVKMEIKSQKAGCLIERMNDVSDLYTESTTRDNQVRMVLSPYAEQALASCVAGLL